MFFGIQLEDRPDTFDLVIDRNEVLAMLKYFGASSLLYKSCH